MKAQMTVSTESVEVSDLFDLGRPRKEGFFLSGAGSGGSAITMMLWPEVDQVRCEYARHQPESQREEGELVIAVSWTVPNFGGRRPWMHCPSERCGRRVGRLFLVEGLVMCRRCARLRYRSQAKAFPVIFRSLRRAQKLRERLGAGPMLGGPLRRPTGMHRRTYECLSAEIIDIERTVAAHIGLPTRERLEEVRRMFPEFLTDRRRSAGPGREVRWHQRDGLRPSTSSYRERAFHLRRL